MSRPPLFTTTNLPDYSVGEILPPRYEPPKYRTNTAFTPRKPIPSPERSEVGKTKTSLPANDKSPASTKSLSPSSARVQTETQLVSSQETVKEIDQCDTRDQAIDTLLSFEDLSVVAGQGRRRPSTGNVYNLLVSPPQPIPDKRMSLGIYAKEYEGQEGRQTVEPAQKIDLFDCAFERNPSLLGHRVKVKPSLCSVLEDNDVASTGMEENASDEVICLLESSDEEEEQEDDSNDAGICIAEEKGPTREQLLAEIESLEVLLEEKLTKVEATPVGRNLEEEEMDQAVKKTQKKEIAIAAAAEARAKQDIYSADFQEGQKVVKNFSGKGDYEGKINNIHYDFDAKKKIWKITYHAVYSDGDDEDLDEKEMNEVLHIGSDFAGIDRYNKRQFVYVKHGTGYTSEHPAIVVDFVGTNKAVVCYSAPSDGTETVHIARIRTAEGRRTRRQPDKYDGKFNSEKYFGMSKADLEKECKERGIPTSSRCACMVRNLLLHDDGGKGTKTTKTTKKKTMKKAQNKSASKKKSTP